MTSTWFDLLSSATDYLSFFDNKWLIGIEYPFHLYRAGFFYMSASCRTFWLLTASDRMGGLGINFLVTKNRTGFFQSIFKQHITKGCTGCSLAELLRSRAIVTKVKLLLDRTTNSSTRMTSHFHYSSTHLISLVNPVGRWRHLDVIFEKEACSSS